MARAPGTPPPESPASSRTRGLPPAAELTTTQLEAEICRLSGHIATATVHRQHTALAA